MDPKGYSMYEVMCESCWHTEALEGEELPDKACPSCKATGAWVGPFAQAPDDASQESGLSQGIARPLNE